MGLMILGVSDFVPVVLLGAAATGLALVILIATHIVGPKRVGDIKNDTYESGMEPVGDTRRRFNVRFYLIAVLFLVFDVEVLFLYPWAVLSPRLRDGGSGEHQAWAQGLAELGYSPGFVLAGIGIFFGLLLVGFIYEWRRGVFKWD